MSDRMASCLQHDGDAIKINLTCENFCESDDCDRLFDRVCAASEHVDFIDVSFNRLTDRTGVRLAQLVASSSTIISMHLYENAFAEATYLALADALLRNESVAWMHINANLPVDESLCDRAFVRALRLNPDRPPASNWCLYRDAEQDYPRLKLIAESLGHPSLQETLALLWL